MQKDNEKAVSEMKQLAESFEKEVTEEGELEPSARCVGSHTMRRKEEGMNYSPHSNSLHDSPCLMRDSSALSFLHSSSPASCLIRVALSTCNCAACPWQLVGASLRMTSH